MLIRDKENEKKPEIDLENFKDLIIFLKDSLVANDNIGPINSFSFLASAFLRYEETKEDEMYLNDMVVYSNQIYKIAKEAE